MRRAVAVALVPSPCCQAVGRRKQRVACRPPPSRLTYRPTHPATRPCACPPSHPTPHPSYTPQKFKKANKYIKEDTIWSYAIQVAHGLASLHGQSVLHRDIKPKNVFLTGKAHVRLGDLGCAKLVKGGLARTQIGECG